MNEMKRIHLVKLAVCAWLLSFSLAGSLFAQGGNMKWLRVGSIRSFFSEYGAQIESAIAGRPSLNYGLAWPAEYGMEQSSTSQSAVWVGCRDFNDPVMKRVYPAKVVGTGYRSTADWTSQMFPVTLKLVGRFNHPLVTVDLETATENDLWDVVDEINESMLFDRMILNVINTSMGVTITRKVLAFSQQYNDNYFVYDFTFKNTGIINEKGDKFSQTLNDCYFFLAERYAFAGESVPGYDLGWGTWESTWGRNTISDVIGTNPNASDFKYRAELAWYGPHSERVVSDDWGCPNEQADPNDNISDEILAAGRYAGCITLHADKSPDDPSDDRNQPRTTNFSGSDAPIFAASVTQYDEIAMQLRYDFMKSGHPEKNHAQEVGNGFADSWGTDGGGYSPTRGYGPYTLEAGDSVHIVVAMVVAGLSREKNREVARNWRLAELGQSTPQLKMPDGSTTADHNAYKDAWVWTCKDSLMQSFGRAQKAFDNNFLIPQPPPAPKLLTIESGGDRISLSWGGEESGYPNFDGYEVWRAKGIVDQPRAVYEKIFECDGSNVVTAFDDTSARRSVDYYYYVVSKDNGSTNDIHPGVPLVSSKFYTITNKPAYLRRPAGTNMTDIRVVPNPYVISKRALQFGIDSNFDRIAFYNLPPFCKIKIFTERGDLINEIEHDNGTGDEYWESVTSSGQIVVSGIYIAYFEVTKDYTDPNTDALLFKKGNHTYRKFIVIR
jgi:hypothetical protein